MPRVIQRQAIPDTVHALSTLDRFDYIDLFAAVSNSVRSPEQWARAGIDAGGAGGRFLWRRILGLRLASQRSSEHLGGWKVARRRDDALTLEAASWFLTANIVFCVDEKQLSVATIIRYDRPIAAFIWPLLSIIHREAMPTLLRRAVDSPVTEEQLGGD